jgi:hypothetical protein
MLDFWHQAPLSPRHPLQSPLSAICALRVSHLVVDVVLPIQCHRSLAYHVEHVRRLENVYAPGPPIYLSSKLSMILALVRWPSVTCLHARFRCILTLVICADCPLGYTCEAESGLATICPANYYCPTSLARDKIPCPNNMISDSGSANVAQCWVYYYHDHLLYSSCRSYASLIYGDVWISIIVYNWLLSPSSTSVEHYFHAMESDEPL